MTRSPARVATGPGGFRHGGRRVEYGPFPNIMSGFIGNGVTWRRLPERLSRLDLSLDTGIVNNCLEKGARFTSRSGRDLVDGCSTYVPLRRTRNAERSGRAWNCSVCIREVPQRRRKGNERAEVYFLPVKSSDKTPPLPRGTKPMHYIATMTEHILQTTQNDHPIQITSLNSRGPRAFKLPLEASP